MGLAMKMVWHDLLFAHWPVDEAELRPHVPAGLEIERRGGTAWIGVVPFHMSGIRLRWLPPVPTTGAFAELNVRTYVSDGEKRGVWFFSLDAESWLAVMTARKIWHLNYQLAAMRFRHDGAAIEYHSTRVHGPAEFDATYRPVGDVFESLPGSLDEFLTERYWMFATDSRGGLLRGQVMHERWPLQRAEAEIRVNTMTKPLGVELKGEPHLLFAKRLSTLAAPMRRITRCGPVA